MKFVRMDIPDVRQTDACRRGWNGEDAPATTRRSRWFKLGQRMNRDLCVRIGTHVPWPTELSFPDFFGTLIEGLAERSCRKNA